MAIFFHKSKRLLSRMKLFPGVGAECVKVTLHLVVVIADPVPKIRNFANVYAVPRHDCCIYPAPSRQLASMYSTHQHELDDCKHGFIS